jgi:diguanylate cyclase (GGDEF)-like protein
VGDEVLKMVARTLSANTRVFDITGRWGGEEFIAILMNMDAATLDTAANKLRRLIAQSSLDHGSRSITVTVSIGATLAATSDTVGALVKRADALMYHSKGKGRNQVTVG